MTGKAARLVPRSAPRRGPWHEPCRPFHSSLLCNGGRQMATENQPSNAEQDNREEQHGVGRLANTSVEPGDMSAIPGVEAPIGRPAEAMNRDDLDAHPATADGGRDRARIVP